MADLDDFFAKKDRKKSKSVKKFATADELAKKLEDTKKSDVRPKKERPAQEGDEPGRAGEEEEWKEYEEPVKDYTGLKIQVLQGNVAPESRDSAAEDSAPDSGKVKGPWNKPGLLLQVVTNEEGHLVCSNHTSEFLENKHFQILETISFSIFFKVEVEQPPPPPPVEEKPKEVKANIYVPPAPRNREVEPMMRRNQAIFYGIKIVNLLILFGWNDSLHCHELWPRHGPLYFDIIMVLQDVSSKVVGVALQKHAPDIHNDDYFPVLGASAKRGGAGGWSTAGAGAGGGTGAQRTGARAPLALGNRFTSLQDDS
ncbi:hypothetical protein RR46_12553 [Papilio xuthus]|uniref:Protein CDV3-like n=1 Tax=Papilio xuthus TaxID=66420 RepID=A0A194PU70_PAPXU|nr:hypothetical protein RR46_12553 [Papilio xuthus]